MYVPKRDSLNTEKTLQRQGKSDKQILRGYRLQMQASFIANRVTYLHIKGRDQSGNVVLP